ncbi:F-box protein At3g07870 [Ricinus communis]|uniref:F-box domain-containing protein n=1 Tax=Ricinus communis TaxID=3988 RepID=B9RUK9_RICCO|nr:F-box protein At3g07870 [Ricinus communis]EEF44996.1 conserved hypothetical protein [Ricinus communis]|eukprot:XP_002517454.1 F-box protein At3g07870 [Ricinus communis]
MASNSGKEETSRNPGSESFEKLPQEIYFDILSRQPIVSLLECKPVSRHWYTSVRNPLLANMHLNRAAEQNLCLLFFSDWPRSKLELVQVEHPEPRKLKTLKTPFESVLSEFEVVGSCNGLICLYDYFSDDPLYIYNPFTIECRELPRVEASPHSVICRVVFGFGFHPKMEEYKVIKIVYYKQGNNDFSGGAPEAFVLTANTPTWRNIGKIGYDLNGPTSEALVNEKLHWLTFCLVHEEVKYREIVSFDLETEQFQDVPRPGCGGLDQINYHLVTLRGCLSAIVSCNEGSNEIWMMKIYNVKASWRKEMIVRNYVPQGLRLNTVPPARRRKNGYQGRRFRVLCDLKNGELLLLYGCRCIVSYNPETGEFKELNFQGLPLEFLAFVHSGSLISVNTVFGMEME